MSRTIPGEARDPELEERFRAAYDAAKVLSASLAGPSLADDLVELGIVDPEAFEAIMASLAPLDLVRLAYAWEFHARPKQRPAGLRAHRVLAAIAARGLGKSRMVAETVRARIYAGSMSGFLAAPTIEDIERYQIGGRASEASLANGGRGVVDSANRVGLLDVFPPHQRPTYEKSAGEVLFHTGAVYYLVSAKVPELRGPNADTGWIEEWSKIPPRARETLMANAVIALRARGPLAPELLISATPTPDQALRRLVAEPGTVTILGRSEENAVNLADGVVDDLRVRFGRGRIARQELDGEILGQVDGAILAATCTGRRWARACAPRWKRVAVAIDPAISTRRNTDPTGIVGGARGEDDELYLIAAIEGHWSPEEWAAKALDMKAAIGAECIVAERNRGGDLVASNVRLVAQLRAGKRGTVEAVKIEEVFATRGKASRLEEVETLGERGRVHLPEEGLPAYEEQATTWSPARGGESPNLLDALGWLAFYLYDGWDAPTLTAAETFSGFTAAQARMPARALGEPSRGGRDRGERLV